MTACCAFIQTKSYVQFFHKITRIVAGTTEFVLCATLLADDMTLLPTVMEQYGETQCNAVNPSLLEPLYYSHSLTTHLSTDK
uniref:Uncharacterized protein n=1 Tax=Arion vulgaris TaxID=1028688 RepID=A0A0B7AM93_9EUPU